MGAVGKTAPKEGIMESKLRAKIEIESKAEEAIEIFNKLTTKWRIYEISSTKDNGITMSVRGARNEQISDYITGLIEQHIIGVRFVIKMVREFQSKEELIGAIKIFNIKG